MKKNLQLTVLLGLIISLTAFGQTNLLYNSDMEDQGDWIVNQCDPNGTFGFEFGSSVTPSEGSGNSLNLHFESDGSSTAEIFVYQPVEIEPGHTYKFSAAMMDDSPALTDTWLGICYVTSEPVEHQGIEEILLASFGTWKDCNGIGFDGLIDTSCATEGRGNSYFTIPDTMSTTTIYFGINVGTWGTTCSIDMYYDNVTLIDSADVGTGIHNLDITSQSFSVYPNPSLNGLVNIEYKEASSLTYYSVYSLLGEEILNGTFNGQTTLDLTYLKKGIYFIRIANNRILKTEKLLLE
jgi:hypothetical protein